MRNSAAKMGFRFGAQAKLFVLLWFIIRTRYIICAKDAITQTQKLSVGETILSPGQSFELGFFTPSNSSKQYIGIWYKSTSYHKVVWVANRESPLQASDSASSLEISKDGNLKLLDGMRNPIWRTNSSVQSNKSVAVLLDSGDLILRDNVSGFILWESFNYPCDTFLPGMTIGLNTRTGEKHFLTSWKTEDDPSPGEFIVGLTPERPPQAFIWNGSEPYWRGGPWDGGKFMGIEYASEGYASLLKLQPDNQQGNVYFVMEMYNSDFYAVMFITAEGSLKLVQREDDTQPMFLNWVAPENPCEVYGYCGPFGVCAKNRSRMCECLKGFVPKSSGEWGGGNWSGGCVRRTQLLCGNNSGKAKSDGFWKLERAKLPDHFQYLFGTSSIGCQQWCVSNCSCLAYALVEKIGCMVWTGDLIDLQQYSSFGDDLFIRLAHSELGNGNKKGKLIASLTTISAVILMGGLIYGLRRSSASQRGVVTSAKGYIRTSRSLSHDDMIRVPGNTSDFPVFEFEKILLATDNFSRANKLGEGGFGSVYKGKLENGQVIAVKRLSVHSGQGDQEFRNEIILISKLQHRNLVRLFGCCVEGKEKLLVYEYMANKSLDSFLFDTKRRMQLSWVKRVEIIQGIARGLQYLHRDSRLRVIHRDLKASNILLDNDMNPKISDFGLARIFQATQELANTHRVVGTFGYMSPEYAMGGLFSEKSDVYSFGVLLLEIISGTKNTSLYNHKCLHLLGYAWQLWEEKRGLDLLDQALVGSYAAGEVMKCIQIGLLCVQEQAADRPTMPGVVVMLSSETELPQPKKPTFTFQSLVNSDLQPLHISNTCSNNEMSTSVIEGR